LLALAEYWYNTSYHSSLQLTPFEVLYGHQPRQVGIDLWDTSEVPELQEWLQDRKTHGATASTTVTACSTTPEASS
jgi:hypothetical protein